jgi:hypothetical protein
MAITYRWEIRKLQVQPTSNGQQNVLYRVHWKLWGTLIDETGMYESSIEEVTTLRFNPDNGFVPFEDIIQNHELIVHWVEERENERQRNIAWRKQQLDKLVMEEKNPTIVDYNPNGAKIQKP